MFSDPLPDPPQSNRSNIDDHSDPKIKTDSKSGGAGNGRGSGAVSQRHEGTPIIDRRRAGVDSWSADPSMCLLPLHGLGDGSVDPHKIWDAEMTSGPRRYFLSARRRCRAFSARG